MTYTDHYKCVRMQLKLCSTVKKKIRPAYCKAGVALSHIFFRDSISVPNNYAAPGMYQFRHVFILFIQFLYVTIYLSSLSVNSLKNKKSLCLVLFYQQVIKKNAILANEPLVMSQKTPNNRLA